MLSTKKALIGLGAGVSVAAFVIAGPAGVASAKSLITGADIKNGTIHGADLAPGLVGKLNGQKGDAVATGAKGATGATGANGPIGPQGPKGDKGDSGADGDDAGVSAAGAGYADLGAHDRWAADDAVHETVQKCKAGEYVTGGGFSQWGGAGLTPTKDLGGGSDVQITVSAPYIASDGAYVPVSGSDSRFLADRWVVRGYNHSDADVDVRAWALCAPIPN